MIDFAIDPKEMKKIRDVMKALIAKTTDTKVLEKAMKEAAKKVLKDKCTYEVEVYDGALNVKLITGCATYNMKEQLGETYA